MSTQSPMPRLGGRSARVRAVVHRATRELLQLRGRGALTVSLIASVAGITPSTIYRRWGDLPALLAEVALEHMRPEEAPPEMGSIRTELLAWAEELSDRMSSDDGRMAMRDVLSSTVDSPGSSVAAPTRCAQFATSQIEIILARGRARGEPTPDVDEVLDAVIAPMVHRALFGRAPPTRAQTRRHVDACIATTR